MPPDLELLYLDHSATTPVRPEVLAAMQVYFGSCYGNASSPHRLGTEARQAVEEARARVARLLGAEPDEILFTSGGTESNNLALKGTARRGRRGEKRKGNWATGQLGHGATGQLGNQPRPPEPNFLISQWPSATLGPSEGGVIVRSAVEHAAVRQVVQRLVREGFGEAVLPVDGEGRVRLEALEALEAEDVRLLSVMHANNEVGTIQPIAELAAWARERGVLVHTDAVQSGGKIPVDVRALGVDLLSLSAHKFYGPKGVGALYVRRGTALEAQREGGPQEGGLCAGTENVPGIVGLARALELAVAEQEEEGPRLAALRDRLQEGILSRLPDVQVNGAGAPRLPGLLNVTFRGVLGEALAEDLSLQGVCVSTGSACSSASFAPSPVLLAMGRSAEEAMSSLRFSLGRSTTPVQIDRVLEVLETSVRRLRALAPVIR